MCPTRGLANSTLPMVISHACVTADSAKVIEIDHDAGIVYCETIKEISVKPSIDYLLPTSDQVCFNSTQQYSTHITLHEEICHKNLNFGISQMANSLNSTNVHYIFKNLSMIAYLLLNFKNQNLLIFHSGV